jgi:hypothetical protein
MINTSTSKAEVAIAKMKSYKLPGNNYILAELLQAGGETLLSEIHKLINSIWNKEELPDQWKEYIILPILFSCGGVELSPLLLLRPLNGLLYLPRMMDDD